MNCIHRQTCFTIPFRDLVGQGCSHCTIGVDDIALNPRWKSLVKGQFGLRDQLVVESDIKTVVLFADVKGSNTRSQLVCWSKDERQIDVGGLLCAEIISDS